MAEFDGVPGGTGLPLEGGIIFEYPLWPLPTWSNVRMGVDDARTGERLLDVALPQGAGRACRRRSARCHRVTRAR